MKFCIVPAGADSLSAALGPHLECLDRLLVEHQLAFMEKRWEDGITAYEQVYELRRYHLTFMEQRLLPLFESFYPQPPHGARSIYFIREKKQIVKTMARYVRLFSRMYLAERMAALDLPRLFDEYMYLKDLLDHHDAREKGFIFKLLDAQLPAFDRKNLLSAYREGLIKMKGRW